MIYVWGNNTARSEVKFGNNLCCAHFEFYFLFHLKNHSKTSILNFILFHVNYVGASHRGNVPWIKKCSNIHYEQVDGVYVPWVFCCWEAWVTAFYTRWWVVCTVSQPIRSISSEKAKTLCCFAGIIPLNLVYGINRIILLPIRQPHRQSHSPDSAH